MKEREEEEEEKKEEEGKKTSKSKAVENLVISLFKELNKLHLLWCDNHGKFGRLVLSQTEESLYLICNTQ